jgi:hypothetical protein
MGGRTLADVAKWMAAQVAVHGELGQQEAVGNIESIFGGQFVCEKNGRPAIQASVLRKFTALTKDTVVFDATGMFWRQRRPGDAPGRTQR